MMLPNRSPFGSKLAPDPDRGRALAMYSRLPQRRANVLGRHVPGFAVHDDMVLGVEDRRVADRPLQVERDGVKLPSPGRIHVVEIVEVDRVVS